MVACKPTQRVRNLFSYFSRKVGDVWDCSARFLIYSPDARLRVNVTLFGTCCIDVITGIFLVAAGHVDRKIKAVLPRYLVVRCQ